MRRVTTCWISVLLLPLLTTISSAQIGDLGTIDFPTSGSPGAREVFLRGALLLHSFEYDDAREAFRQAQELDPEFGMAYWGEAMTHNRPIWVQLDLEDGRAVLNRLGETTEARLARLPTKREQGYLRAVEKLFGEGDKLSRDLAYSDSMAQLASEYPDDLNAASLYALSLLGTLQAERDFTTYMKAAAVAEEVFAKNPNHPGATHYLIHSYDDPIHAPLGLRAARVYAGIAPAAAHAQHMPSHIFLAMGMWEDVVKANEASWEASEDRIQRKNLNVETNRGYHALWWLQYGYLQLGRYLEAQKMLSIMEEDFGKSGSPRTRSNLISMRATQRIATSDWKSENLEAILATSDSPLLPAAADLFVTGLTAVKTDDLTTAQQALTQLKERKEGVTARPGSRQVAVDVMEKELEALVSLAKGDHQQALAFMREATDLEDSMNLQFGPPVPVKPSHELLGEILLELDRPEEAEEQFELALTRAPHRSLLLLGLARAAARSGHQEKARRTYAQLEKNWHGADSQLPELQEIRAQ